jgi:hypothetical protein
MKIFALLFHIDPKEPYTHDTQDFNSTFCCDFIEAKRDMEREHTKTYKPTISERVEMSYGFGLITTC